jgi:nitrogen regulatory protein P-II 1
MKKIEAIIKPFKLDDVMNALDEIGIEDMTVSEVKAFGRPNIHTEVYRGIEFPVGSVPEIKIELMIPDNLVDAAVAAIVKGTKATKLNPGKVLVFQVDDVVRSQSRSLVEQAA